MIVHPMMSISCKMSMNEGLDFEVDSLDLDENLVSIQVEDESTPLDDLNITNLHGEADEIGNNGVEDLCMILTC